MFPKTIFTALNEILNNPLTNNLECSLLHAAFPIVIFGMHHMKEVVSHSLGEHVGSRWSKILNFSFYDFMPWKELIKIVLEVEYKGIATNS